MIIRKALFGIVVLATIQSAQAAELHVLLSGSTLEAAKALGAEFTKQTGTTITFDTGSSGDVQRKMEEGDTADVVSAVTNVMDILDRDGKLKPGTKAIFVRTGFGAAVRAGAPKPDISTVEKFRAAMLAAKSVIVRIDPPEPPRRPGARLILDIFDRLGIADQMAAKTRVQSGGNIGGAVASGEIEIAVQNISQLAQVKGLDLVGLLPEELQFHNVYAVAVGAKSADPKLAQDFIAYMLRAEATAKWETAGFERIKN